MENETLVLDFVEWVAAEPRSYADVMNVWRTACPRLTIWEDAIDAGLVHRSDTTVRVSVRGVALLEEHGRRAADEDDAVRGPITTLATLFRYDDWANRTTLASLQRLDVPPPRAVDVMGHIVGCQWLWLQRIEPTDRTVEVWPQLTRDECRAQLDDLARAWMRLVGAATPASLGRVVSYTNSAGEPWKSSVHDILLHVVMHSGYHRGQLATMIKENGGASPYTDFVHCMRQGLIDGATASE